MLSKHSVSLFLSIALLQLLILHPEMLEYNKKSGAFLLLVVIVLAWAVLLFTNGDDKNENGVETSSSPLKTLMHKSYIHHTTYEAPSDSNLKTAELLFHRLLETRTFSNQDEEEWSSLNLKIQKATDENGEEYAVVSEPDPELGVGHGFFAVKLKLQNTISKSEMSRFLHAPHRPSDMYTHLIVYHLLTQNQIFGAAAWDTTFRKIVDLAKEPKSYFNAMTKAMAKVTSTPVILQLHGFAKEAKEMDVDAIFSSTRMELDETLNSVADCLKTELKSNWILKKYPKEVDFLGGTQNINAQLFYEENPSGKFVHLETSKKLRLELLANMNLREGICQCFK